MSDDVLIAAIEALRDIALKCSSTSMIQDLAREIAGLAKQSADAAGGE